MILPPPFVPKKNVFCGVGVGRGLAIGPVHVITSNSRIRHRTYEISPDQVKPELALLEQAIQKTCAKFKAAQKALPPELVGQEGDILSTHLMLLNDPHLIESVTQKIEQDKLNAESALAFYFNQHIKTISAFKNEYLKSRVFDVETVRNSVIATLQEDEHEQGLPSFYQKGCIVAARELSPSEVATLPVNLVAGLVTERGSRTSHSSLVAKTIGIPCVVGVSSLLSRLGDRSQLILDAPEGHVIIDPDHDTLSFYQKRKNSMESDRLEINRSAHLPATTLDDHQVRIMGNIELVEELPDIMACGGEGIGLFRTEYIYTMKDELPTENELFESYRRVVATVSPSPVVIRTLDLGADKITAIKDLTPNNHDAGNLNQALGLRAIRFCLKNQDLFRTQLRAILRASVFGELRIMLPMVSCLEEIRETKRLIFETTQELKKEGHSVKEKISLGVMIEVPAAVIIVKELGREADFLSIGTNDLIQYSLALDRTNPEVMELYQPHHPAIIRMIKTIIDAGKELNIPVSVCGDMAAETISAPLLVGLGAEILSMPSGSIPKIKRLLRMSSFEDLQRLSFEVLESTNNEESENLIRQLFRGRFDELT
ncbi:MAG: phosphoenolpyruvate--protein phosphotransferase [Deltaproteobacteria bacterium]|jgi:phosphotransferase system enzyme I (PtsI)|nr:phosphoenolpyruvate--protein phosphotransferase [Deltaproteobacteria bacterium]